MELLITTMLVCSLSQLIRVLQARCRLDSGAPRIPVQLDSTYLARTFGLTRAESHVAAALVAGNNVRDIAVATRRTQATVRTQVQSIHRKLVVHTQADQVRQMLTTARAPLPRNWRKAGRMGW